MKRQSNAVPNNEMHELLQTIKDQQRTIDLLERELNCAYQLCGILGNKIPDPPQATKNRVIEFSP